jgi:DNA-binding transcriptional LysR family regulator
MDRFDSLQAFVRVAEAGSFAEAARQLGLTTSAVSKRVTQLEALLGVRLLQRTTRHVRVTDLGSLFYERVVEIVTLLDDAFGTLQHGQATPAGLLRLSSPTSFGMMHVAPLLCAFHTQYPALRVEIILNDRVVNPVEEGFDVCLQDVGPRPGSMVERRLCPLQRVVCAAPQYLAIWNQAVSGSSTVPLDPSPSRSIPSCVRITVASCWMRLSRAKGSLSCRLFWRRTTCNVAPWSSFSPTSRFPP